MEEWEALHEKGGNQSGTLLGNWEYIFSDIFYKKRAGGGGGGKNTEFIMETVPPLGEL